MEVKAIFSGDYEVTSEGEVYSYKKGARRLLKGAVFHSGHSGTSYRTVLLTVDGKQRNYYVHRLVAQAFVPNPDGLPCVRHIDGDSFDNRAENLAWCTRSEAIQHAVEDGRIDVWKRAQPCAHCGKPMISKKSNLCGECQKEEQAQHNQEQRRKRLQQGLAAVEERRCSPLQYQAVCLRREGRTFQSIGDELGISVQYAHQLVKLAAAMQNQPEAQQPQYIARHHAAQQRKLERKRLRLQKALEEANKLSIELRNEPSAYFL